MIRSITVPPFDRLEPFLPRPGRPDPATRDTVAAIMAEVAERGDAGVQACLQRYDGLELAPGTWEVPQADWQEALDHGIDLELRDALETAAARIRDYHLRQKDAGFQLLQEDGSILGMRVAPVDRAGIYVPGGKASYPSSVLMSAIPAAVAGVPEIIVVTPAVGGDRCGAGRRQPGGGDPPLPRSAERRPSRRWRTERRRSPGWTRSWARATAGWPRPSVRSRGWSGST